MIYVVVIQVVFMSFILSLYSKKAKKEMVIEDLKAYFEKKVKENPANNHLRVAIEVERPIVNDETEIEVDERLT